MRFIAAVGLLLVVAMPAIAATHANVSPKQLAVAINKADSLLVPYRLSGLSPRDIGHVRCDGPDEEPTEFQCVWRQRTSHGWATRRTWLAIEGRDWRVIG